MKSKDKQQRCDLSLIEVCEDISAERVSRRLEKKTQSFRRLTKAIANLLRTDTAVRERIINAILEDDRGEQ